MTGKRLMLFLSLAFLFVSGCCQNFSVSADKDTIIIVNDYNITRKEFENEFNASAYGKIDTPEARKDFLNTLIDRKLILQYAQKEGLDKKKSFLRSIEKFWEQSLLKIALDNKTKEVESKISTSDWEAKKNEETKMMSDWMSDLRKNANITIKDDNLRSANDKDGGL